MKVVKTDLWRHGRMDMASSSIIVCMFSPIDTLSREWLFRLTVEGLWPIGVMKKDLLIALI